MSLPEMPAPTLVADAAGLSEMVSHLSGQSAFAIDTESDSLYAYHEKVCLMQISSEERDFLVDPFRFESLEALGPVFADEGILKVFHAGDYDLACLKRDYHFTFINLFDTMLAATALAEPNLGLAGLLEKYLGITLDKKYQRANWGERPLKPEMLAYAQADSHYLLQLQAALTPLLVAVFVTVIVAAMAGQQFVWREVLILALIMTVSCYVLFVQALKLNLPAFPAFFY